MIYQQTNKGLGSEIILTIDSDQQHDTVDQLFIDLWAKINSFESRYSRFIASSELSIFNSNCGAYNNVSQEFLDILTICKNFSQKTDGIFNPFILPALVNAGYDKSLVDNKKVNLNSNFKADNDISVSNLLINNKQAFIPPNTAIDLGGIGKGYLADQLALYIENTCQDYWISLGGDIIAKRSKYKDNWHIDIQSMDGINSMNHANIILPKNIRSAVATSGTVKRQGIKNGHKWHHLIDPSTLKPAETDILLATVYSSSAVEADIYASCLVIIGSKNFSSFVNKHKITDALVQGKNNNGTFYLKIGDKIQLKT